MLQAIWSKRYATVSCDSQFVARTLAVWTRFGDAVQYVPGLYGKPLDVDSRGKNILFVDFSLKRDEMAKLGHLAKSIFVLDHHLTAKDELSEWGSQHPCDDYIQHALETAEFEMGHALMQNALPIIALFDMDKSGARLAWEFCHPDRAVPDLIRHIEDRDLWRFTMPGTAEISAALRTYPQTFELWQSLLYDPLLLVSEGETILRGHRKNIESMIAQRYWDLLAGHRVPIVNVPYHYASDAADAILKAEPNAPFCAAWFRRGDGMIQFSLRSQNHRVDVSEVAKMFGGGGHRNAAGFQVPA